MNLFENLRKLWWLSLTKKDVKEFAYYINILLMKIFERNSGIVSKIVKVLFYLMEINIITFT